MSDSVFAPHVSAKEGSEIKTVLPVEGPGCKLMSHAKPSSETEITSATELGVQVTASEAASSSPASMTANVKTQGKPFTD